MNHQKHFFHKLLIIVFLSLSFTTGLHSQSVVMQENKLVNDTILLFDAQPALGFNYPYLIRLPKQVDAGKKNYLLVETNNTGNNDSLEFHQRGAIGEAKKFSLGSSLCPNLKVPFLIPVFPRPAKNWQYYTHAFDRDAALIDSGLMKRLDLQLIAMIKNAATQLNKMNITIYDKILMTGFSASGTFANRFTLLHPEMVAAVATGGINGLTIIPLKKIKSDPLIYPIGIFDVEKIFNRKFDVVSYKNVPQFIYMGGKDDNDAVLFDDAYSEKERKIIHKHIGKIMLPDRWNKCQAIHKNEKTNVTFKTYPNIGHETDMEVFRDVSMFFLKIIQNTN